MLCCAVLWGWFFDASTLSSSPSSPLLLVVERWQSAQSTYSVSRYYIQSVFRAETLSRHLTRFSIISVVLQTLRQGLLDMAFDPMFGITDYPMYFYLSYTCDLHDGVSA